jgi:hypothetical protein
MNSEEKELIGRVKARFLNRVNIIHIIIFNQNLNEVEYLLSSMVSENKGDDNEKKEKGLFNAPDTDRFKQLVNEELYII